MELSVKKKRLLTNIVAMLIGITLVITTMSIVIYIIYLGCTKPIVLGYITGGCALLALLFVLLQLSWSIGASIMDKYDLSWKIYRLIDRIYKPKVWDK